MEPHEVPSTAEGRVNPFSIFLTFLRLGLTSFGGPIAHLGYFRQEFVVRRRQLDDTAYADLVSLCQFLPGPASSQVGISLGLSLGGVLGVVAAWLGFTLPSAVALVLFAMGLSHFGGNLQSGWPHGLKVVAVAVVAQAIWGMGKAFCPDKLRATMAICAAFLAATIPFTGGQVCVIAAGGLFGWLFLKASTTLPHGFLPARISRLAGSVLLAVFLCLLLLLPVLAASTGSYPVRLFDAFYRTGSLVFGGGHVVLPLLQSQVVPQGWVSNDVFLAGYGMAQAVPGPLFTFAAYLGAASTQAPSGWVGAGIALTAIFLPSFLLVLGILPFWDSLRRYDWMRRAMLGINASVVGLLLAAFYNPVWTSAIHNGFDISLAACAFLLLEFWKFPPWLVVILTAVIAGLGAV